MAANQKIIASAITAEKLAIMRDNVLIRTKISVKALTKTVKAAVNTAAKARMEVNTVARINSSHGIQHRHSGEE